MAVKKREHRYEEMSRADLLREINAVQAILGTDGSLRRVAEELQVYQEEVRVQQAQLIDAQRDLEDSRDRYADLFEYAPVGYLTLDATASIADVNLIAAAMLGFDRVQLIGHPMLVHVAEPDRRRFLEHLTRCRSEEGATEVHVSLRKHRGGFFPASMVTRRAATRNNRGGWHTAVIDLTDTIAAEEGRRRAQEERLAHAQKEQALLAAAEAKDRFLATLSHELRTPLTPIVFCLDLLEKQGPLPDSARDTVAMIRRNVEVETKLIDDLLDTSRIVAGKLHLHLETVDLHELIQDVLAICAPKIEAAGLVVDRREGAERHHVRGDPTRLQQVLWNLVTNAIRHTPRGGRITVQTRNDTPGRVMLVVSDDGVGIDPELVGRLFEPFAQGNAEGPEGGLGLGLAIARGIVEAHHGSIAASSEGIGAGARFEIGLATAEPVERPLVPSPLPRPNSDQPRVLLVEDHADTAMALGELLGLHGFSVAVATSFTQAVTHRGEHFDVLVTDIGLPDGDGLELPRALSPERPLPAIALSGFGAGSDLERSRAAGFRCHLVKPVDVRDLVRAIGQATSVAARA
jgi:PAS domain S-box-containing protein